MAESLTKDFSNCTVLKVQCIAITLLFTWGMSMYVKETELAMKMDSWLFLPWAFMLQIVLYWCGLLDLVRYFDVLVEGDLIMIARSVFYSFYYHYHQPWFLAWIKVNLKSNKTVLRKYICKQISVKKK